MKRQLLLVYVSIFVLFSLFFLFLIRTPLFKSQTVLFYRGNLLLLTTTFFFLLASSRLKQFLKTSSETFFAALVMSVSIHLSLFVVFPVTFDRSVTTYLLNRLGTSYSSSCSGLTPKQMEDLFIKEYVRQNRAIDRRIKEQSVISTLKNKNNCVTLTGRGRSLLLFAEVIRGLYAIRD